VVDEHHPWPITPQNRDILRGFTEALIHEPWITELPIFLPSGRLGKKEDAHYWTGTDATLPLVSGGISDSVMGAELRQSVVLWNGSVADLLASDTNFGRYYSDA
jgi:hypothetical protein